MFKTVMTMGFLGATLATLTGTEDALQLGSDAGSSQSAPGAALWWADYDGDGLSDAFILQPDGKGKLLRNVGNGSFEDVTERTGLGQWKGAHSASWADFDADGRLDLYLASYSGESHLLRQLPEGLFEEVTGLAGLPAAARPMSAAWIDFDADGMPDLHLSTWGEEMIFHNMADGRFAQVPLEPASASQASAGFLLAEQPAELADALRARSAIGTSGSAGQGSLGGDASGLPTNITGGTGTTAGGLGGACAPAMLDTAGGSCIRASSTPELDLLYPITENLFVSANTGRVGIGTTSPSRRLSIAGRVFAQPTGVNLTAFHGDSVSGKAFHGETDGQYPTAHFAQGGSGDILRCDKDGDTFFQVRNAGGVTAVCESDSGETTLNSAVYAESTGDEGIAMYGLTHGAGATLRLDQDGSGKIIRGKLNGEQVFAVTNSGRVVTTALQITGGGDLVEGFEVGARALESGTVLVIDPEQPGRLMESSRAYDVRVAGAISGAGGVKHGIRMGQDGVLDGDALVAMTGRIYVKCSAENGAITAGDMLTTAELAGHAMKATDRERCFGAVIGKALTELDEGTGLVLVLVSLQ